MAPSSAKGPNLLWFWIGSSDPFFILSYMTFCSFDFVVFALSLTTIYLLKFDCFGSVCVFVR